MNNQKIMTKDIPELTGLRGIAAMAIFFNHILLLAPYLSTTYWNRFFTVMGYVGMDLFFILSGIVIYYNYADKVSANPSKEMPRFLLARFARLYPLYFLFLIAFFIVNTFLFGRSSNLLAADITSLPMFLFGVQDWVYGYINNFQVVHLQGSANISWSISCEIALYLLFIPFILIWKPNNTIKRCIILFLLALMFRHVYLYFTIENPILVNIWNNIYPEKTKETRTYLTYYSPIFRFFEFLCGCAIAMIYSREVSVSNTIRKLFSLLKVVCVITLFLMATNIICLPWDTVKYLPVILALLCLAISFTGDGLLRSRLFIIIGEISYSTYLLHIAIIEAIKYFDEYNSYKIGYIILYFVLTYFISYFCYKYYEIPMKNKVKSFFSETQLGRN